MDNEALTPDQQLFLKKKQIFMSAVLQAVNNGLSSCDGLSEDQFKVLLAEFGNTELTKDMGGVLDYMIHNAGYKAILFSHSFLKAFFGEYWKEHGYQILILEQPLLYFEQYLQPVKTTEEWK